MELVALNSQKETWFYLLMRFQPILLVYDPSDLTCSSVNITSVHTREEATITLKVSFLGQEDSPSTLDISIKSCHQA